MESQGKSLQRKDHTHQTNSAIKSVEVEKRNKPHRLNQSFFSFTGRTSSLKITPNPHNILNLQKTIGNQAVGRFIQTKLKIGQPGDKYEQEADQVADAVMSMPKPRVFRQEEEEEEEVIQPKPISEQITPLAQRQGEEEEEEKTVQTRLISTGQPFAQRQEGAEEEDETLQTKSPDGQITPFIQRQVQLEEEEKELIQTKLGFDTRLQRQEEELEEEKEKEPVQAKVNSSQFPVVTHSLEARLNSLKGGGQPLPKTVRAFFEPRFGVDFSNVRVHSSPKAIETAKAMNARAYTIGQNIVFNNDQYFPYTTKGMRLLAHELSHTIQQGTAQRKLVQPGQAKPVVSTEDNMPPTIQRAMKFEYQIKKNRLYRDDGTNVLPLPRKYGPEDFLVKGKSGVRLESETHGQPEFETEWTRKWSKLSSQIDEARQMTDQMNSAPKVTGSNGIEYRAIGTLNKSDEVKKLPLSEKIKHLGPGQGFRTKGNAWTKAQKKKNKFRVTAEKLNFRPVPKMKIKAIFKLKRSDVVEVVETKGRWSKVKAKFNVGKLTGWVSNRYLEPVYGWYETSKEKFYVYAEVIPNELDVRQRPGKKSITIGTLNKSDEVKILVAKSNWSKVKTDKLTGWVENEHIKPLRKKARLKKARLEQYIPSGKETKPLWSRETILQPGEKLLVEINDPSWTAYIQPSESFSLEQFESFFEQFREYSGGSRPKKDIYNDVVGNVNRIMNSYNTRLSGLKNLLLMVVYYIKVGGSPFRSVKGKPAKFAFPLMSRTNFGSIYMSLLEDEKILFKDMVENKAHGILSIIGVEGNRQLLIEGHAGGKGPRIYQWLKGITKGKDLLSAKDLAARDLAAGRKPQRISAAMGKFRVEKETGRQKGLIRFEARISKDNWQPASKWLEHASNLFDIAMRVRRRDPGKGKTGLKPG
jgi:hypothetical protein